MAKFNIAVLVNNQEGVLNRVTSLFRRRNFNIDSLTVSETETPKFSRITITFQGDVNVKNQLVAQLYKLHDVIKIKELDPDTSVSAELLLIKMANNEGVRGQIDSAANVFNAKVVNYTREAIIFKVTGDSKKIDNFINLMRDFEILEICRTGVVSLEFGDAILAKEEK